MVNPIKSAVQDYVTTTITHKILGGDKHQKQPQQQQQQHSGVGGIGGIFNQLSSTISSALNPNQQQNPTTNPSQQQQQQMSGSGYYGGGSSGYPGYGGGDYPAQQPPYPGGYDYNNQGPPAPGGGGYNIGFNVDPSYGPPPPQASVYAPYGSGNGSGGSAPYPPSSQSGYPPSGYSSSAQPPAPYPDTSTPYGGGGQSQPQQQQFGTGYGYGGGGAGYPPPTQPYPPLGGGGGTDPYGTQQQFGGNQPQPYGSGGGGMAPAAAGMASPSIRPNPSFNAQHTAELLRKAMKGFGCDKGKVIQALVNCNNAQRQEVIRVFKQMYGKDLIKELKSELTGDFEDLVIALMEHPARYDAYQLRKAMQGLGTKEHVLIEIMTTRSNVQIQQVKQAYRDMYGADLERDLTGETSGHFKRLLVALCSGARDESWQPDPMRANQDAHKLYRAGEGRLGTDESTFNAVLAAQSYAQLRLVFEEYQKVSGHSIDQAINAEFSGDIRDGLLAVVKSIRNRPAYFAELLYNSMKGLGTRDNDLIRLVVSRSEIDMADIRTAYQRLYAQTLEQAIASDCSGAYKDGLIAIVKGFYH